MWRIICILLELAWHREIIGYSADTELVCRAFSTVKGSLFDIQIFHSDWSSEFDNALIEELLDGFPINRSLSMKGAILRMTEVKPKLDRLLKRILAMHSTGSDIRSLVFAPSR